MHNFFCEKSFYLFLDNCVANWLALNLFSSILVIKRVFKEVFPLEDRLRLVLALVVAARLWLGFYVGLEHRFWKKRRRVSKGFFKMDGWDRRYLLSVPMCLLDGIQASVVWLALSRRLCDVTTPLRFVIFLVTGMSSSWSGLCANLHVLPNLHLPCSKMSLHILVLRGLNFTPSASSSSRFSSTPSSPNCSASSATSSSYSMCFFIFSMSPCFLIFLFSHARYKSSMQRSRKTFLL